VAAADASRSPVSREDEPRPDPAESPGRTQLERADVDRARERPRGGGAEVQVARGERHVGAPPAAQPEPHESAADGAAEGELGPAAVRHQRRGRHRDAEERGAAVRERDGDVMPGEPELRERQQDAALEGQPVMPAARPPQAHPAEIEGADVRDRPLVADRVDGAGRRRALRPAV